MPLETSELLAERYGVRYRWYVTGTILLGLVATTLTTTIVNVAIPDIMGAFGIGQDRAQWLATGALAATTVGMLTNAWLIRTIGERATFLGALVLFMTALLVAGASPNENVLIASRIAQGAVAGIMHPLSMYVLFRVFPPEMRGTAMGFFGLSALLGPALGPTIGGLLINHFNWRYVFFAPIPVSLLAILLGSLFMPQREESGPGPSFDWIGFMLLAVAIGTLLTGLSNGQREGWESGFILTMFGMSALAWLSFLVWETATPHPLVDLRVFANSQFAAAAVVAFLFGLGLFGSIYLVPLFVQTVPKYTPLAAGLLLMPAGVILGLFMPLAGWLSDRIAAHTMIMAGLLCVAISAYWTAQVDTNTPFWTLAWWVVLSRIGLGLIKPALNLAALRPLRPELLGQGAGMINFARQIGGAFGVNTLSVMLDRRTFFHGDALTSTQVAGNAATAETLSAVQAVLVQAGLAPEQQASVALHFLGRMVHAQAYTMGFRDSFMIVAVIFAVGLIPAWIIGRARRA